MSSVYPDSIPWLAFMPGFEDISPDIATNPADNATAGRTLSIVGDASMLYAVSLNAGVWKTGETGEWKQLPASPPYAYCIAIDPSDAAHLVVGERDGDATDMHMNRSGVWESRDAGTSWLYMFDPLSLPGSTSQAVPAVAFSNQSTLFIGTFQGIGRKEAGANVFDFSRTPGGIGFVTALSVSETKIWARTATQLLVSSDDGLTWSVKLIPSSLTVGGTTFTINFTRPPASLGDLFSLAAFDAAAYMFFKPVPDVAGNKNTLLVYSASTDTWTVQVLNSGDGTGLNGRRFIKMFMLRRPDLPLVVGGRLQLFLGVGQDIAKAEGLSDDGTLQLTDFAHTWESGAPNNTDPIHADLWDFHLAHDGNTGWVACDGGVLQMNPLGSKWVTHNRGLHTHHISMVLVLPMGDANRSRVAYATADNDAWYRDTSLIGASPAAWKVAGDLGDASTTKGDVGSPAIALLERQADTAQLTTFGALPPPGSGFTDLQKVTLSNEKLPSGLSLGGNTSCGQLYIQFIQTLPGEPPLPLLDAVMLAHLPLKDSLGNVVPGILGQPNPSGRPVLIRNTQFGANPDANLSKFQNWKIEADDLPMDAAGFWVSGGHESPVYYAVDPTGGVLYRRQSAESGWQALISNVLANSVSGGVFVNPYDPNHCYVLTSSGVKVSFDGGGSFQDEATLTALLTNRGMFPLTDGFSKHDPQNVAFNTRANRTGTLSAMAFDRDHPGRVVAASPFTGIFYTLGDGRWLDLSGHLPRPPSPVETVGVDREGIYVGLEGRGVVRIRRVALNVMLGNGGGLVEYATHADDQPTGGWGGAELVRLAVEGTSLGDLGSGILSSVTNPGGILHVCNLIPGSENDPLGFLVHTTHTNDGWDPWRFVPSASDPDIRPLAKVSCAVTPAGRLHVFVVSRNGSSWHTIRNIDGSWQQNWDGNFPPPDIRPIREIACAADPRPSNEGDVWVIALGDDNNTLSYTLLSDTTPALSWMADFPPPDIRPFTIPGPTAKPISCAVDLGGSLHVLVVDKTGRLYHMIRDVNGEFSSWTLPPIGVPIGSVSCATDNDANLHVCMLTPVRGLHSDGQLWYARRTASGRWDSASFAEALTAGAGGFIQLSVSHATQ